MSCGASSGGCGGSSSRSSSGGCGGSSSGGCGGSAASSRSSSGCGGGSSGGCPDVCKKQCCPPLPPPPPPPKRASGSGKSKLEKKILCSKCPIDVSETETISANGVRGIYVNKSEADKFSGPVPLSQYKIFNDPNPKVITKQCNETQTVTQEVQVKFLQPPAPGPAGDIIIREKAGTAPGPAPPIIIRQEGKGGSTGKSQCFRECPPPPCPKICPKVIEVCAPAGNPPPRRVIIEKLPAGQGSPGPIFAERWLAASGCVTRNVRYEKAPSQGQAENPRNVIIEWQAGPVDVKTVTKSLGKQQEDPCAYFKKHGSKLVSADQLPEAVKKVKAPSGSKLAASGGKCPVPKLTGCVKALKKIDLAAHGLSEYQSQVDRA